MKYPSEYQIKNSTPPLPQKKNSSIYTIITGGLLFLSETLPFINTEANGIIDSFKKTIDAKKSKISES